MSSVASARRKRGFHGSSDWYTPTWLMDRITAFLGVKYYDPCPARYGRPIEVNGLAVPWRGHVFCNPPYGALIPPWIAKFCGEPMTEGILLVSASTDTYWFAPLFAYDICFIRRRVKFTDPNGDTMDTPHASVLVYRGRRHKAFADAFSDLGPVMRTYRAKRDAQPHLPEVPA